VVGKSGRDVRSSVRSDAGRNTLGTDLDQALSDKTSALRLAQNVGADYLMLLTIGSYARQERKFNDPALGISVRSLVYTLRGTFRVIDGVSGGSLGGNSFACSRTVRQTETLQIEDSDTVNSLLEEGAGKVVEGLAGVVLSAPAAPGKVEITIACGARDLAGNEITLPDLRVTEDGRLAKGEGDVPLQVSATIEIDGFAVGTTPAKIQVAPGPHKLHLSRPGMTGVELNINAAPGLTLAPTMVLSEAGFARWREIREFLSGLEVGRKLTDARAEEIRANATRLRQSGFLIEYRVNTTNAPTVINKNSVYSVGGE
jgi:hypothetical protein